MFETTLIGEALLPHITRNYLQTCIYISEMNSYVYDTLILKPTPCAQVKWVIDGDILMAVHGLMQERASL